MRSPRSLRLTDIERGSANSAYVSRAHNAARVIVRKDDCRCIHCQRRLDHLARIHAGLRQRAPEHLAQLDHAMLRVEEDYGKDFVLQTTQPQSHERPRVARAGELVTAADPAFQTTDRR